VTVSAGETIRVDMTLLKDAPTLVVPTVRPGSISDFDPAWDRDGEEYTHAGSPIAFRITPALGTFHFKIQLLKGGNAFGGGKKVRWVLGYTDGRNHTLLELEKSKFRRTPIVNGKPTKNNADFKLQNNSDIFDVEITVTPTKIIHRVGGLLVDQDSDAPNLTNGKFMFIVNSNEQIGISGFTFTPAR